MPEEPPSVKRPDCAAATPVEPKKNESGSTTVLCWLELFVNGSVAIFRTGIDAPAARLNTSAAVAASPTARAARLGCMGLLLRPMTAQVYYRAGSAASKTAL